MSNVIPIEPPFRPELLLPVQLIIERILDNGGNVFEFGSGHSTLWFAEFCNVVSVEHDQEWYDEVMGALGNTRYEATVHLVFEDEIADSIENYGDFDLILVDCLADQRTRAARLAMSHVKPGGWILLDDSHWPSLAQARKLLSAWPPATVSGAHRRLDGTVRNHQTSLYRRIFDGFV
jgi:predicted O-methyltransferase YrrM